MYNTRISLGKCIARIPQSNNADVPEETLWQTIQNFGINRDDLSKLHPSYNDLCEICKAIEAYRSSVKYLKLLKHKIQ